jgi:hypothetical protein
MKNKFHFYFAPFFFFFCLTARVFAQSSSVADNLHFTAVARDVNNNPIVSSTIYIRIEIFEGIPAANNKIYCEQTPATTNQFGEFSLNFPNTSNPNTTFCQPNTLLSSVQWQTGNKWVRISFQPNGNAGLPFTDIATFQFTTVPYAFAARTAERLTNFNLTGATNGQVLKYDAVSGTWKPNDDIVGTSNVQTTTPLVGNGTSGDKVRLQNGTTNGQSLEWNGSAWATGGEHAFVKQGAEQINNERDESFDVSNMNEIIVPATGTYLIMASLRVSNMQGEDNYAQISVVKNGTDLFSGVLGLVNYQNNVNISDINGTQWDIKNLVAGDKLKLRYAVSGTGTINYNVLEGKILIQRLD